MPAPDPDVFGVANAPNLQVLVHADKAVIRRADDPDEREQRFFASVPVLSGSVSVLATAAAVTAPGFLAGLWESFDRLLNNRQGPRPTRVWTAVSGLHQVGPQGRSPAQWLADDFRVEVVAPDGPLALVPGGAIFAGTGNHCWRLFRIGAGSKPLVTRYPTPSWETALPRGERTVAGLRAEAVPAGLLLLPEAKRIAPQIAVAVPQSAQRPRILLANGIEVKRVAAAVAALPPAVRSNAELVPLGSDCDAESMQRLAGLLGHDVHAATGMVRRDDDGVERTLAQTATGESWQTFASLLRHSATTSQVVVTGAPPRGWLPAGPLLYRWGSTSQSGATDVLAKVVPAGLALISASQSEFTGPADQLRFDPGQLTIAIGVPFQHLSQPMPQALAWLLGGLSSQQRARARLLVLGVADEPTRQQLQAAAADLAPRLEFPNQSAGPSKQNRVAPITTADSRPAGSERTDVDGAAEESHGTSGGFSPANRDGAAHPADRAPQQECSGREEVSATRSGTTNPNSTPRTEPDQREDTRTARPEKNPAQEIGQQPHETSAKEHGTPERAATEQTQRIQRPQDLTRAQQPVSQSSAQSNGAQPPAQAPLNGETANQAARRAGPPPVSVASAHNRRPGGSSTPPHDQQPGQLPPVPAGSQPELNGRSGQQRMQQTPGAQGRQPQGVPLGAAGQRPDANAHEHPAQFYGSGQAQPPKAPVAHGPNTEAGTARAAKQRPGVPPPLPKVRPMTVSSEPAAQPSADSVAPQKEAVPQVGHTDRIRVPDEVTAAAQPSGAQDTVRISHTAVTVSVAHDVQTEAQAKAELPQPELVPAVAEAIVASDHSSTAEERAAFATAVGDEFEESLPSVNGALARYPVLREAAADAKNDFVAVHLYIGSGAHGGTAINRALRGGDAASVREQAACLVSGLRRLPVHRGASFRAARTCEERSPLSAYRPGSVLEEPGFLSATAASDLTVEQEHVDVVIWSYSARRTAALGVGLPDEVVFIAASRFKVLAVEENEDAPPAVLLRELRSGEDAESDVLTEADEALLPRLRRALSRRHSAVLRVLEDDDQAERFSEPVGLVLNRTVGKATTAPSVAPQPVSVTAH